MWRGCCWSSQTHEVSPFSLIVVPGFDYQFNLVCDSRFWSLTEREGLSVVFDRSPFGLRSSFIKSFHCFFPPLFLFQLFRFPVLIWFGALSLGIDLGLRGFILGFPFWGFFLEFIYEDLVVGFQIRLGLGLLFFQYFVLLVGMGGFGLELLFS